MTSITLSKTYDKRFFISKINTTFAKIKLMEKSKTIQVTEKIIPQKKDTYGFLALEVGEGFYVPIKDRSKVVSNVHYNNNKRKGVASRVFNYRKTADKKQILVWRES